MGNMNRVHHDPAVSKGSVSGMAVWVVGALLFVLGLGAIYYGTSM
jgi:hypothetical protein